MIRIPLAGVTVALVVLTSHAFNFRVPLKGVSGGEASPFANASCTQGATLATQTLLRNGSDVAKAKFVCDKTLVVQGKLPVTFDAHGSVASCAGPQTVNVDLNPSAYSSSTQVATQRPNWNNACRTENAYIEPGSGCVGKACSFTISWGAYWVASSTVTFNLY